MLHPSLRDLWTPDPAGPGHLLTLPQGWMQGRAVFGGLVVAAAAALALRRARERAEGGGPEAPGGAGGAGGGAPQVLRSVSTQLLRPLSPGPVTGIHRVVRAGRAARFDEVRLSQGGDLALTAQLVFAAPRACPAAVAPAPVFDGPDPETLSDLPAAPGVIPEFISHLRMRFAGGSFPFSGADTARFTGYARYRDPAGGVEGVLGLLDAWPCPSLSKLTGPAPASTVAWTAHVLHVPESFEQWFPFEYETVAGEDGWHTVVGRLHDASGRLLGWTEQLVAVFA